MSLIDIREETMDSLNLIQIVCFFLTLLLFFSLKPVEVLPYNNFNIYFFFFCRDYDSLSKENVFENNQLVSYGNMDKCGNFIGTWAINFTCK